MSGAVGLPCSDWESAATSAHEIAEIRRIPAITRTVSAQGGSESQSRCRTHQRKEPVIRTLAMQTVPQRRVASAQDVEAKMTSPEAWA
jgi:hypothetical protein